MPKTGSSSVSSDIVPQNYLDTLRSACRDLAQVVKEVPASRSPSPRTEKRVENLRDRVREAYNVARGDTADGKWVHLAELLRMGCTRPRYRRWAVGVRTGEERKEEEAEDWISPETEFQFMQWDRKWKHNPSLKEKVENWKSRIDLVPHTGSLPPSVPISLENKVSDNSIDSTKSRGGPKSSRENDQTRVLKDSSGLGFPVVKSGTRSLTAAGVKKVKRNGHSDHPKQTPTPRTEDRHAKVPDSKNQERASDFLHTSSTPAQLLPPSPNIEMANSSPGNGEQSVVNKLLPLSSKDISEVSEMLFLPPSFPPQLQTSTPQSGKEMPLAPAREKPPPIPFQSEALSSSPPSPFPSSPQTHPNPKPLRLDNDFLSSSLPLPSPTRKRPRPLTPPPDDTNIFSRQSLLTPQPLKKSRTMPAFHPGDSSDPPPTTPPRSTTPLKSSRSLVKGSELPGPSTPLRQLPTLTELLASAKKPKALRPSSHKTSAPTTRDRPRANHGEGKHKSRELESTASTKPGHTVRDGLFEHGVHHFTQNPEIFAPDFISSQPPLDLHDVHMGGMGGMGSSGGGPYGRGSNSFLGTGYNSQFDLEGQIDRVSELLERDVDFDGWLRDIPEVEETCNDASCNEVIV